MASRLFSQSLTRSIARPYPSNLQLAAREPAKRFNSSVSGGVVPLGKDPLFVEQAHAKEHAAKSAELWRKISFYICLPASFVVGVYVYQVETAHIQHRDHELALNGGELPEEGKPKYEYQNIRKKPFPWGMQTLFFNPKANYPAEEM